MPLGIPDDELPLQQREAQPTLEAHLIGKTISAVTYLKHRKHDDRGWVRFDFTDNTHCIVIATYGSYTGRSNDEYPTDIYIDEDVPDLIPLK